MRFAIVLKTAMKVLEQTPTRLKLRHYPCSRWLAGAALSVIGLGGLVYCIGFAPVSVSLICKRVAVSTNCKLQQFTALGIMHTQPLYDLQGARVHTQSSGRRGKAYSVRLSNGYSEVSLLQEPDGSYSSQEAIVDQINQFVNNPSQPTLTVQQSGRFKASLFSLLAIVGLATGIIWLRTPVVTCAFYKRLNKVAIDYERWYGAKQTVEYPLSPFFKVEVEEKRVKQGRVYRVVLITSTGERLPLHRDYTKETPVREAAYQVQKFLATFHA
ncbi:MAG: hypothetical protein Kow00121_03280 [Elainellaceae cyanobacterium]